MSNQSIRQSKTFKIIYKLLEYLFLALAGVYLFYSMSKITTFGLKYPEGFAKNLLIVMAVVAVLRWLSTPLKRWKTLAALGLGGIYCLVYRSDGYRFLLYLAVLTVGLIDIDYRKILKVYLCSAGSVYCAAVLAGKLGVITNYVYTRAGRGLRSAWGICYPTDFAAEGFFLLLALWTLCKRWPDWAMLFPCMALLTISRYIAYSWNSFFCGVVFVFAILYCIFERRVINKRPGLGWMKRGVNLMATLAFPMLALAMFGLMALYAKDMDIGYRIDNLISGRINYAVQHWREFGLSAFGKPFQQAGLGFSAMRSSEYNFVDSSYPLIVLRYGWVLFLALCVAWGWMVRKAIKDQNRRLVLVLALVALHSFMEHHFTECHFNILLVMPFTCFASVNQPERVYNDQGNKASISRGSLIAHAITALLCAVTLWLFAPKALSAIRTVLDFKGLHGGADTGWQLLGVSLGMLGLAAATVWALDRLLKCVILRSGSQGILARAIVLAICLGICGSVSVYADHTIDVAAEANAEMIEADRAALEIAVKAATGRVYSGVLPAAYQKSVAGLSASAYFEDDLVRHINGTFLLPSDNERNVFFHNGCLYVQISDDHALYTEDRAVIKALTEAGYHLTGYYSTPGAIDMASAAETYRLKYSEKYGALLSGKKQSLRKGPYIDLYGGRYAVTFELRLPKKATAKEGTVCTLRVTTEKGKNVLLEKKIERSQFDKKGKLTVSIPFSIGESKNVAFRVIGEKGRKVYVSSIRYVRTPDYDIHGFYDQKLRLVRQEYYTLDGQPILGPQGFFAVENGYDASGNAIQVCYYDQDNALTLHTAGYAELRRTFNAKRQMIREEYYGTDGQPIALMNGQAAEEREYDADGRIAVQRYYGIDGQPVILKSGYAEIRHTYNEEGKIVSEEYFGIDGEPIPLTTGQYQYEQEYDDAGNVIVRRYCDSEGNPRLHSDGYAEVHWQYNGLHQIVREEFFDAEGQPVMIKSGYAANEREYDDAGNMTVCRYYGLEGQPVIIYNNSYAEIHRTYNAQRQIIREEYFDVDGQPKILMYADYCAMENEYDENGNVSVRRFYGLDGELVLRNGGYAEVHWQYNDMRQLIREEFYDTNEQLTCINTGAAINEREYDDAGNITTYRYYDDDNKPIVTIMGYAEIHRVFNDQRQVIREEYYGTNGELLTQAEGHCILEHEYDEMGNENVLRYCDAEGHLVETCEGYAEVRRLYDNKKQIIQEKWYGADGEAFMRAGGYSAIEQEYDDSGKLTLRRYLDQQGNAVCRSDGYSEVRWLYDTEHAVRSAEFFDLEGQPVSIEEKNLAMDVPTGWSRWYTPWVNSENSTFTIGTANLGEKKVGDVYTCHIEIEFKGVTASPDKKFAYYAQGAVDGKWGVTANIWNPYLVRFDSPPEDGIYQYTLNTVIDDNMAKADLFNLGFRCDYWSEGSFRVRNVKVEKGDRATSWTPGL